VPDTYVFLGANNFSHADVDESPFFAGFKIHGSIRTNETESEPRHPLKSQTAKITSVRADPRTTESICGLNNSRNTVRSDSGDLFADKSKLKQRCTNTGCLPAKNTEGEKLGIFAINA
ncbi:hypothetical protein K0M31_002842, partial [Melipona bicolor]